LLEVATAIAPMLAAATRAIRIFRIEITSDQEGFSILVPSFPIYGFPQLMIIRTIVAISGEIRGAARKLNYDGLKNICGNAAERLLLARRARGPFFFLRRVAGVSAAPSAPAQIPNLETWSFERIFVDGIS
jgi:hypothetical protein